MQAHNSHKYSLLNLKLGQEEVYSVCYRSINRPWRLEVGSFKYDPGKETSQHMSERAEGQTADSKHDAYIETEENINFASS